MVLPMAGAMAASAGMGLAGSLLSGRDARRQAGARSGAIQASMRRNREISKKEALANYKAGGIQQGELLAHLLRMSSPESQATAQAATDERQARIAALAGPATAAGDGTSQTGQVAQRAIDQIQQRQGLVDRLNLANALLSMQGRGRDASARTADVRASRAIIPLQETLFKLSQDRMQNQADLQAALGDVGPGWGGVAGQAMSGMSTLPFLFA